MSDYILICTFVCDYSGRLFCKESVRLNADLLSSNKAGARLERDLRSSAGHAKDGSYIEAKMIVTKV